jgi:hypothetical protein
MGIFDRSWRFSTDGRRRVLVGILLEQQDLLITCDWHVTVAKISMERMEKNGVVLFN